MARCAECNGRGYTVAYYPPADECVPQVCRVCRGTGSTLRARLARYRVWVERRPARSEHGGWAAWDVYTDPLGSQRKLFTLVVDRGQEGSFAVRLQWHGGAGSIGGRTAYLAWRCHHRDVGKWHERPALQLGVTTDRNRIPLVAR